MEKTAQRRLTAVALLMAANGVVSISQTNISAIYLGISLDFHESIYGLGLLNSSYFAGYGLLEIPGAILAAKYGPKRLALFGGSLNALGLAAGFASPSFLSLVISRAVAGAGFGLLFPAVLVLIVRNLGGSAGLGAALSTVAFSLGGSCGVLGWSVLSSWAGWRPSLLVELALTVAIVAALAASLPRDELRPGFEVKLSHLKEIFADRAMIALAVAIFGGAATANLVGSFLVYYLEEAFRMPPAEAGLVAAAALLAPLFTSLMAGRMYDTGASPKLILGVGAVAATAGAATIAYPSPVTAAIGAAVVGLSIGIGGTVFFSVAKDLARSPEYENLYVGFVDSVSLGGLFVSPLYFSAIALRAGYPTAWLVGSVAAVAFFFPVLLVKLDKGRSPVGKVT